MTQFYLTYIHLSNKTGTMARRPRDPEVCEEFAANLRTAVVGKVSKKTAAATLGVSRQMLDVYLKGKATPGSDVIMRAMRAWKLPFAYRGREITISQLTRPARGPTHPQPEQLLLPIEEAILALGQEDLDVRISKKETAGIELQVTIRFAS